MAQICHVSIKIFKAEKSLFDYETKFESQSGRFTDFFPKSLSKVNIALLGNKERSRCICVKPSMYKNINNCYL